MISLSKILRSSTIKHCFNTLAPRWMVFFIDLVLVFAACFFSLYLVKVDNSSSISLTQQNYINTAVVLLIYGIMSITTQSHCSIIRYTGLEDAYRLFKMVIFSAAALIITTTICQIFNYILLTYTEIIEISIFSFTFILLERLAIKSLYNYTTAESSKRKRVIILGSDVNSISITSALLNEINGNYEPVALLSLNSIRTGNNINGIPIIPLQLDKIEDIFKQYDTNILIFLSTQMEVMQREYANYFIDAGIKLLQINQIEEFDSNKDKKPVSSHVYNIEIEDILGREPINTNNPDIRTMIEDRVVMVTGAAGSIGSEIVRQVARLKAAKIILLDQAETPMHAMQLELEKQYPKANIQLFIADIRNKERLRQLFEQCRPEYIFHAAAYKHVPMMESNPTEAILTNVGGTRILADLASEYGVEKFVMISTDKAVNPTNIMGCSKRIAEIYVQALFEDKQNKSPHNKVSFITTRFGNVLGSNGSVVPLFKDQIAKGGPVTITHRDIIRYFMTIPEACNLVLEAGCMGHGGEIFIFDMGKPIKIYDLARRMIRLSGLTPDKDIKIVETGLRPGEKLFEELLNDKENTIATYHKKIMIAQVRKYQYEYVMEFLVPMLELARKGNAVEMVRCMKQLIPEFKSQNSIYEELDKEKESNTVPSLF